VLDISPNNVLQSIQDDSILSQIEQGEIERPTARKILSDRTIYNSRPMSFSTSPPVLCDLGEARVGNQKHRGDIMPGIYRAPEVVLGMDWDTKVDILGSWCHGEYNFCSGTERILLAGFHTSLDFV
jgi:serine/threonine-protein kinase SRPK3